MPPPLDLRALNTLRELLAHHFKTPTPPPIPSPSFIPLFSTPALASQAFTELRRVLQQSSNAEEVQRAIGLLSWGLGRCKLFSKVVKVAGGLDFLEELVGKEGGLEVVRICGRKWGGDIAKTVRRRWSENGKEVGDVRRIFEIATDVNSVQSGDKTKGDGARLCRRGLKEMKSEIERLSEEVEDVIGELEAAYSLVPEDTVCLVEELDGIAEVGRDRLLVLKARAVSLEQIERELDLLERATVDEALRLRAQEVKAQVMGTLKDIEAVRTKWTQWDITAGDGRTGKEPERGEKESDGDEEEWEEAVVVKQPVASVIHGEGGEDVHVDGEGMRTFNDQLLRLIEDSHRTFARAGRGRRRVVRTPKGRDRKGVHKRLRAAIRRRKHASSC